MTQETTESPSAVNLTCRVPMWINGLPAGHCGETAFGEQEVGQRRYGSYGDGYRGDRWYPGGVWTDGYCSGPCCFKHGGPKEKEQNNE